MTREDYLKGLIIKRFGSIRKFAEYTGIASSTITSMLSKGCIAQFIFFYYCQYLHPANKTIHKKHLLVLHYTRTYVLKGNLKNF